MNSNKYDNELKSAEKISVEEEPEEKPEEKKRKKKKRCEHCRVKLRLFTFTCKCGMVLCQTHLSPHNHVCSFDYMKEKKNLIEKNNPKLGEKFVRI